MCYVISKHINPLPDTSTNKKIMLFENEQLQIIVLVVLALVISQFNFIELKCIVDPATCNMKSGHVFIYFPFFFSFSFSFSSPLYIYSLQSTALIPQSCFSLLHTWMREDHKS